MTVSEQIRIEVVSRAGNSCEYCHMRQSLQGASFHVEHIVPKSKGGTDTAENLALACPSCNLQKSNRTHAIDEVSKTHVAIFHPRQQRWNEHFAWDAYALVGKSPTRRATIQALQLNQIRRVQIREAEQRLGLFPQGPFASD